jgi:hypothetical protein
MYAIHLTHCILLNLAILLFGEEYKIWNSSLWNFLQSYFLSWIQDFQRPLIKFLWFLFFLHRELRILKHVNTNFLIRNPVVYRLVLWISTEGSRKLLRSIKTQRIKTRYNKDENCIINVTQKKKCINDLQGMYNLMSFYLTIYTPIWYCQTCEWLLVSTIQPSLSGIEICALS